MKEKLDQGFMPLLVLVIVCLISTALLSITNELTAEARARQEELAILASKQKVFPAASSFKSLDVPAEYEAYIVSVEEAYDGDERIGYLVNASEKGYGGPVSVYVGITEDRKISGIDLIAQDETPGLGQNVQKETFYRQFIGSGAENRFSTSQSGDHLIQVDAVAAATISSDAAINAINHSLDIHADLTEEE